MVILLILAIVYLTKKQMKYEKVSLLRLAIIPVYCFILLAMTFKWGLRSLLDLAVLVVLAYGLALLQIRDVQIRTTAPEAAPGKPIVETRAGASYLYGWLAVVAMIVLSEYRAGELHAASVLREELLKDFVPLAVFWKGTENWMIWAITGLTGLFYAILLARRHPAVSAALLRSTSRFRE